MNDRPAQEQAAAATVLTDPDAVQELVRHEYVASKVRLSGVDRGQFRFEHHNLGALDDVALSRMHIPMHLDYACDALDGVLIVCRREAGGVSYDDGRTSQTSPDVGGWMLVPPQSGFAAVSEELDMTAAALTHSSVAEYAEQICDLEPDGLRFHSLHPRSPALGRYWDGAVTHIRDNVMAVPEFATNPIIAATAQRSLCAALLSTFPNTASDAVGDPDAPPIRGEIPAARLRAILDYITAHADRPIGAKDIAEVAGVPARQVVEALRRRFSTHPAQLLWETRLRGTWRDLRDTDPVQGATVSGIAARWGFARVGAFRIAYRSAFDEWPEDTLRA